MSVHLTRDISIQSQWGPCSIYNNSAAVLYLSSFQLAQLPRRSPGTPSPGKAALPLLGSSQQAPPDKGWPLDLCIWAESLV